MADLAIMFGKGKHADMDHENDGGGSDDEPEISKEEVSAYRDLVSAMKSGDDEAGAMALKNFLAVCGGY